MYDRYVIRHRDFGVYLGAFMGVGIWSRLDPAGQSHACAFGTRAEAARFLHAHPQPGGPKAMTVVPVRTVRPDYATVAECEAAGLLGWEP